LGLLLGDDFKARKLGDPKGGRYRDVRGVTTAAHDNAAYAGIVVARVYVYQRPSRQTSAQALKSMGLGSTGTPVSPK
jgi:hypothetical protein